MLIKQRELLRGAAVGGSLALALGINPFDALAFSSSDVQGGADSGAAARDILQRVFGYQA